MHQFLRDTADIDARSSEPPRRSGGGGLDVVEHGDASSVCRGFFGGGEASGSAAEDEEVVFVGVGWRMSVGCHLGWFGRGCIGCWRLGEPAAPIQGVVASTDEFRDDVGVALRSRGQPTKGRRGMVGRSQIPRSSSGTTHCLSKVGVVNQPLPVGVTGGKLMLYHLDAMGKQEGERGDYGGGAFVEAAG